MAFNFTTFQMLIPNNSVSFMKIGELWEREKIAPYL